MRHYLLLGLGTVFMLSLTMPPVLAHHSFSAQYDGEKRITLEGPVTKVEWMNPHIYFYMNAKNEDGEVINWAIEGDPPTQLFRRGWKPDTLEEGDVITVEGALARDGSPLVSAETVMLGGRQLFASRSNPNESGNR